MKSIDRKKVKSESEVGKINYGEVWENASGNDTVPISVWLHGSCLQFLVICAKVVDAMPTKRAIDC